MKKQKDSLWHLFFTPKSVEELISESKDKIKLRRSLNALHLVLMGIGAIVGAGIFVLTGTAASQCAGPAVTLSFVLGGVACACAGLCYAELASAIPVSGSAYTYMYASLGEMCAWITAVLLFAGNFLVISTVASGWSGYTLSLLRDFGIHFPAVLSAAAGEQVMTADGSMITAYFNLPASFIVIIMSTVLYFGVQTSALVNTVIVTIKMSVLFLFVVLGVTKIDLQNWIPFIPENTGVFGKFGISGIVGGASIVFLAYNGFDTVSTAAQETKDPQKNLPIGILGSLLISTLTYVMVAGVLTGLVNYKELNVAQPIALAVDKIGLPWFSLLIKFGAICGLTSVVLVLSYGLIRVLFVVTQDGLLPKKLMDCHKKHNTPHIATILVGSSIAAVSGFFSLENLVDLGNFCTISLFALVCFAALQLRYKQPKLPRSFRCPLMPYTPAFGILLFAQILAGMPSKTVYFRFAMLISVSLGFYLIYGSRGSFIKRLRTNAG